MTKKTLFNLIKTSFIERLAVFSDIFGYSFLAAVLIALAGLAIAKYFLYFSFFITGILACALLLRQEKTLYWLTIEQLNNLKNSFLNWFRNITHHNHC